MTRCKLVGLLTPAQSELLKALFELNKQLGPERLWRPRDLGAYRSSHHALTLRRLQERGLVARAPLEPGCASTVRASFGYRITDAGVQMWEMLCDAAKVPLHAVFGGLSAQDRVETLMRLAA